MSFQIKDFTSIAASMINWMKSTQSKLTDFNVGSVGRTLVEAPAIELDELYQQMLFGIKDAIPVSVYSSFDFAAIGAESASGLIRVIITSASSDTLISAGTTFTPDAGSNTYTSAQDAIITAGNTYVDVLVTAAQAGSAGNIAAGTTFTMSSAPNGLVSAKNLSPFINGVDAETPDAQKVRFNAFIQSLNRGTVAAILYGLKTTALLDAGGNLIERVVYASVVEPYLTDASQPIAWVQCYIHNGVGSTSSALVNQARNVIYGYYDANGNAVPGWKAAGVKVDIYAATEVALDVGGTLTVAAGYDQPTLAAAAQSVADAYIVSLDIGTTFQLAALIDQIMNIPGVANFVPADVTPPAAPVAGSVAGGTLTAETYYAVTTYVTADGETLASPETSKAVAADNLLTIASPAAKTGALGWNLYVGTASGTYQKQNTSFIAFGTNYTQPISGLVAGDAPPALSTARATDIAVSPSQKLMPGTIAIS